MPKPARKSAEQDDAGANVEDFKEQLGPFVVAAETTRMPMVFTDAKAANHPIIFVNQAFLKLTGHEEQEVLGQSFDFLIERNADPEALNEIQAAFGGARDLETQVRYRRKDNSVFWVVIFVTPVRDESGAVVQHFASFVDVSRHKEEESRLRFLVNELNHRVQNSLPTVLAIAGQTLQDASDQKLVATFEGRVQALAKAQGLLGGENWDSVGLRDLAERILRSFGVGGPEAFGRISVRSDDVRLPAKAALILAMAFHELATNATRFGALSDAEAGTVNLAWRVEVTSDGDRLRLCWQEAGGPPVSRPTRRGFGSRLIEHGLAQELDGEVRLEFAPTGVVCQIILPLPGRHLGEISLTRSAAAGF